MTKYEGLEAEAAAAGLGLHNEEGREAAVRNVTWTHEDPRALFDEMKGKPIAGRCLVWLLSMTGCLSLPQFRWP